MHMHTRMLCMRTRILHTEARPWPCRGRGGSHGAVASPAPPQSYIFAAVSVPSKLPTIVTAASVPPGSTPLAWMWSSQSRSTRRCRLRRCRPRRHPHRHLLHRPRHRYPPCGRTRLHHPRRPLLAPRRNLRRRHPRCHRSRRRRRTSVTKVSLRQQLLAPSRPSWPVHHVAGASCCPLSPRFFGAAAPCARVPPRGWRGSARRRYDRRHFRRTTPCAFRRTPCASYAPKAAATRARHLYNGEKLRLQGGEEGGGSKPPRASASSGAWCTPPHRSMCTCAHALTFRGDVVRD